MATSGKDWRKLREEGQEVELPSGLVARLRGVGFTAVLKSGYLPDFLTAAVVDAVEGKPLDLGIPTSKEQALEKRAFIDKLCAEMFLSPRLVDNPIEDDEIGFDDLDDIDRTAVLVMWGSPTAWLRAFRFRSETLLQGLLAEQGLSNTAEPVPETETPASE